jgi:hypothetical protein
VKLTRTLAEVARDIGNDWHAMSRPYSVSPRGVRGGHPAHLYYSIMRTLHTDDLDTEVPATGALAVLFGPGEGLTAADCMSAFLASAKGWRGTTATRVKAELRDALAHYAVEHHLPTDGLVPATPTPRRDYGARLDQRMGRRGTYDPLTNPRGYR